MTDIIATSDLRTAPIEGPWGRAMSKTLHGERLAVAACAVAVAMLPLVVPTGPGNSAPADVFMLVAIAATLLWARTAGHRWRFPFAVAVSLFIGGGALGALNGPAPGAGFLALVQDIILIVWCWTIVNLCHTAANLRVLVTTWAYSSIAWAGLLYVGLFSGSTVLTGQIQRQGSRVAITLDDPNYAANYFLISIMIIWATACPRHRAVRYPAYAALLVAIALTGSNSGIIAVILGTTIAVLVGAYRRHGLVPAISVLAFLLVGGYLVTSNLSVATIQTAARKSKYSFLRDGVGRSGSEAANRALLLRESIHLYQTGGELGQGPVSTKVRLKASNDPYVKEAHDDYVAALVERGAIGLLGLLVLVGGLVLRTARVGRSKLAEGFDRVVVRPNALAGAVAGTLVTGTVYELLHVRHVWTLFAFAAALYLWGRE